MKQEYDVVSKGRFIGRIEAYVYPGEHYVRFAKQLLTWGEMLMRQEEIIDGAVSLNMYVIDVPVRLFRFDEHITTQIFDASNIPIEDMRRIAAFREFV